MCFAAQSRCVLQRRADVFCSADADVFCSADADVFCSADANVFCGMQPELDDAVTT